MSPPSRPLSALLALLAIAGAPACPAAEAPAQPDSYHAAVGMDFPRAAAAARQALAAGESSPEARFNLAVVLLNEQPQSAAKLDQARQLLAELAADATLPADLRAAGLYYHGRLEQAHARPANAPAAAALYTRLLDEFPDSAYAERAFAMLVLIRQYEPMSVADKRARLLALDAEAQARLRSPLAWRLYHLSAGLAWSRLVQDDAQAFAHYRRVHELKLENDYENSNLLVRLAELSRRRGDTAAALGYFREFIARYPADRRTSLAREWIAALEGRP